MLDRFMEILGGVLSFGRIKSTSIASSSKTIAAKVEANEGEDTTPDDELFGVAAVLQRPKAPDSSGECEAFFARLGDEKVIIATRDKRWQVSLEDGEVVLRAFGPGAAYVKLAPDGTATIVGGTVKLGSDGASDPVALSSDVDAKFAALASGLSSAVIAVGGGGAATVVVAADVVLGAPGALALPTSGSSVTSSD